LIQQQTIDVRGLKQDEAIVKMELGEARVMVGAKTFDHIMNLKDYEGNISRFCSFRDLSVHPDGHG